MTPEGSIKQFLRERVKALGGEVRFIKWLGQRSAPDCLVLLPTRAPTFVETKAPGKRPRPAQVREFARLERLNCPVLVCPTRESIDEHFPLP